MDWGGSLERMSHSPLFPAPNADGSWSSRSISTTEVTAWYRLILSKAGFDDLESLMAHGCALHPCAIDDVVSYGMSEDDDERSWAIGHQEESKDLLYTVVTNNLLLSGIWKRCCWTLGVRQFQKPDA